MILGSQQGFPVKTLDACVLGATGVPCRCHILKFKDSNATEGTYSAIISMFGS